MDSEILHLRNLLNFGKSAAANLLEFELRNLFNAILNEGQS